LSLQTGFICVCRRFNRLEKQKKKTFGPKNAQFLHFEVTELGHMLYSVSAKSNKMASLVEGNGLLVDWGAGSGINTGKSATEE
jgi:hypothetical protein